MRRHRLNDENCVCAIQNWGATKLQIRCNTHFKWHSSSMTISAMSFNLVNLHVLNHTRTHARTQATHTQSLRHIWHGRKTDFHFGRSQTKLTNLLWMEWARLMWVGVYVNARKYKPIINCRCNHRVEIEPHSNMAKAYAAMCVRPHFMSHKSHFGRTFRFDRNSDAAPIQRETLGPRADLSLICC